MEDFDKKTYTEVWEIIRLMSEEMQNKIPEKLKEKIKNSRDESYQISFELIENGKISEEAKQILSVIYTDYLASDVEREIIKAKEKVIANKKEKEAQEKYGTEIKFKQKEQQEQLVVIKKKKFYEKIFEMIKKILRIK